MDYTKTIEEFRAAMESFGLSTLDEIIGDGKLHRFHVEGDSRAKENGWYILHVDERPAGQFGSWKTGESEKWFAAQNRALTAKEKKEIEKRVQEQEKEKLEEQEKAAERARTIWDASTSVTRHPYLERKGIKPFGLRVSRGDLIVPIRSWDGRLKSLQFIDEAGNKRFLSHGQIEACYSTIGRPKEKLDVILVCEGYATGASIHQATELPVVVAFNAGNLEPVAWELYYKYPTALIIICADNDQWTQRPVKNPGLHYAEAAARVVSGLVVYPDFKPYPGFGDTSKPTDFNDLAQIEGLPRVAEIIETAIRMQPERNSDAIKSQSLGYIGAPIESTSDHPASGEGPEDETSPALTKSSGPIQLNGAIDFPHQDRHKPLATIENVQALLEATGVRVRYDVIRKDIDIQIPGQSYLVDTARNDKMTWLVSQAALCKLPVQRVPEFVSHIAGQNPYNPVAEWISSRPWDGKSRLKEFYSTIEAVDEKELPPVRELKEILMFRWMLSAVAAAFRPKGVSAHGVLTLQGEQYLGKTAWFKSLVPGELHDLMADGMLLDPKDKDSVYQVVTKWLVELGEIDATFRRSDIAQLKSFITRDRDVLRRAYARSESEFARRTVFFASVNPDDFLADPTGNRRFWTIACAQINHQHGLDMQQVWAEFYFSYQAGDSWYLTHEELLRLNIQNKAFEAPNAIEEMVYSRFDWDEPRTLWQRRTATEIAQMVGIREPSERHLKQVAKAVREKTGQRRAKSNGRSLYFVPDLIRLPLGNIGT